MTTAIQVNFLVPRNFMRHEKQQQSNCREIGPTKSILLAFLFSFYGSAQAAVLQYAVTDLGTFGGLSPIARGISSNGLVVAQSAFGGASHAFLYNAGTTVDLGSLAGLGASVSAVNSSGQATGSSQSAPISGSSRQRAVIYQNGSTQDLGTLHPLVLWSRGDDINESGHVVGESGSAAFVYRDGVMQNLGLGMSGASSISDNGSITGWFRTDSNPSDPKISAFLIEDGVPYNLGSLMLDGSSSGLAVNNSGQVTGEAEVASDVFHAFIYSNGVMNDLGTLNGTGRSKGRGINDSGTIVGESSSNEGIRAFIYHLGEIQNLNDLVTDFDGLSFLSSAYDINNRGDIVGTARFFIGEDCFFDPFQNMEVCIDVFEQHAFLATAIVPIPPALWLFGPAVGLLGWMRRKKA